MTKKICFVGAPSTGKSTLAKHLAEELIKNNYSAELVGEAARDYIIEHGTIDSPRAQLAIAIGQKEREETALSRNPQFIVCDVPAFLSHVYFNFLNDKIFNKNKNEEVGNQIWQEVGGGISSYNFVFFLPPELAPEEDGIRLYTKDIKEISDRIQKFLNLHHIQYHELTGTIQDRISKALKIIKQR